MRPIWSGAISFGLVSVPVRMFPATESKELRFHFLHKDDLTPIGYDKVRKDTGEHVDPDDLPRGDELRRTLCQRTERVLDCLARLRVHTPNRSGFPIVEVPLARHEDIDAAGRFLFENGIYVTLAAYPLVPKTEVGFRIQVTAANSQAEIEQLVDVIGKLAAAFDLRPAQSDEYAA